MIRVRASSHSGSSFQRMSVARPTPTRFAIVRHGVWRIRRLTASSRASMLILGPGFDVSANSQIPLADDGLQHRAVPSTLRIDSYGPQAFSLLTLMQHGTTR